MLLKRLEAYGFKSFADRIEIEFDKGITAVVGPNGSGKSNITDAVRWVMGEQNIRSLRGSKAEDIIFAGSSARKQSGIAEVSLTFDNADGKLPLEFQEITITRRLFRSGESEFYINKARCRLKDIYSLFADTGLGRDSISVISQNKVDEVLNAKPEDRRLLFEECAGITKYRDRKKEAVKKLEVTQQNALRIGDIIAELEKQLGPLSAEAEKTGRHNELKTQYDKYKLSYILCSYEKFSAEEKKYTEQLEQSKQALSELSANIDAVDGKIASVDEAAATVEKKLNDTDFNNRKLTEEIDRNRNKCTVLEERIKQNSRSLNNLKTSREETFTQKKTAEAKLLSLQADLLETAEKKRALAEKLSETNDAAHSIEQQIAEKEHALNALKAKSEQHRRLVEQKQRSLLLLQRDMEEKRRSCEAKEAARTALENEHAQLAAAVSVLESELQRMEDSRKTSELESAAMKKTHSTLKEELHTAEAACSELAQKIDRTKERINILANMQKAYEGFGSGAKRILTAAEHMWHRGICGSVAELISVERSHITAIEVALGGNMQNIVTEDTDTAKSAIEFLKQQKLGRVTFLPLSTVRPKHISRDIGRETAGFIAYADELVRTDDKYRPIIQSLLARTVVVDNIDNALKLARMKNYSLRIVTLSGEILHAGGAISGGSIKREISFLNREEEIRQLSGKNEEIISSLLMAKTKQGQLLSRLSRLESEIQAADEASRHASLLYAEKNAKCTHLQADRAKSADSLAAARGGLDSLRLELRSLAADYDRQHGELNSDESADNLDQDSYSKLEHEILTHRTEQKQLQQLLLGQTSEFAAAEQTLTGNNEKLDLIKAECTRCETSLINNQKEQDRLQASVDESLQELSELQISSGNLQQLHAAGRQEYDKIYAELMDKRVKSKECSAERKQLGEKAGRLQENIHQLDIKVTKISFESGQCEKNLQEQYNLSPQAALAYKEDMPEELLLKNIKKLQGELSDMGAVNPNAITEYNALNDRYQFMNTQLQDLIRARDDLQQIIEQMDATMSKQFKEAFGLIEGYFNDIFIKLFGGGKASLILTDRENILASGVEITVQAPGKKNQNLALLSGGERTLTVIALLFSFLHYSPAPFSVLDEIDAPLDEANIRRFGMFLRDYAERTQFIVVTHRRGTMEAADVMYGVTIEDAGISKIVSVKLEEAEE